jgi:Trypsin-like peptidase domain
MIKTRPTGEEPESTHVLALRPEEAPRQGFPLLRAALWWALPATALVVGGRTAATVLVAAGETADVSITLVCGAAAAIAIFGGMCLFERLVGLPGAALGAGVALQLIHSPFVQSGVVPGWYASAVWIVTALAMGALTWWVHARRPPVIRTARPVVVSRGALAELTDAGEPPDPEHRVVVSGRFRVTGWPRTALQAVELPGNLPAEIDAVVSIETASSRGTAFMIRNDGRHADLVTNEHLFTGARGARVGARISARVSIAGTVRRACVLPRPDPERFARRLGELVPHLDRAQRLRLAHEIDLRLVRIDSSGLPVAPLPISTTATAGEPALSVGYPHGGIPRFVWPVHPVPLPVIGIGRLVRDGVAAELWTPWRVQSGNSGGPVFVREHGRLRVAAVTHVQHAARRSRGKVTHIPAVVLRAYVGALDSAGAPSDSAPSDSAVQRFSSSIGASSPPQRRQGRSKPDPSSPRRQ